MSGVRVRLSEDLTRYHPSLHAGTEGITVPSCGTWAHTYDRFVSVCFPEKTLDVLWKGLEIIDADYLAERAAEKQKLHEQLREATNVEWHVGPRGGFRCIVYEYPGMNASNGFKDTAEEIRAVVEGYGIRVKTVVHR